VNALQNIFSNRVLSVSVIFWGPTAWGMIDHLSKSVCLKVELIPHKEICGCLETDGTEFEMGYRLWLLISTPCGLMKDFIRLLLLLLVIATLHAMKINHPATITGFSKKNTVGLGQMHETPVFVTIASYSTAP
jgi:hypothetical protein